MQNPQNKLILEAAFSDKDLPATTPFDGVVINLVEHLLHRYTCPVTPEQGAALMDVLREAVILGMQAGQMTLGDLARHLEATQGLIYDQH